MIIVYIVVGLIVLGLLVEYWKQVGIVVLGLVVAIICYAALGAMGLLGLVVVIAGIGLIVFVMRSVKEHDEAKSLLQAQEYKAQKEQNSRDNELIFNEELENNYSTMGYMNLDEWKKKLPNYIDRDYETSFEAIVKNFTEKSEERNIRENKEFLQPFITYLLSRPQGSTVNKMLAEVKDSALKYTHYTSDKELLEERLIKATVGKSKDVPPLLSVISTEVGDLYQPTKYCEKLFGSEVVESQTNEKKHISDCNTEISLDDL